MRRILIGLLLAFSLFEPAFAQIGTDKNLNDLTTTAPREYEIGGIKITGSDNLDQQIISLISGLQVGDKITVPGEETTKAIKNLWRQKLFDDVGIYITEVKGNIIFLEIRLTELPKLSKYGIRGLKKSKQNSLREELDLNSGTIVTENLIISTKNTARQYFVDKGYLNAEISVVKKPDTTRSNSVILEITVDKGEKVKIKEINIIGNEQIADKKVRKAMKETKRKRIWNIFKGSKFQEEEYEDDLDLIIAEYNSKGYRDARVVKDSIYQVSDDRIAIDLYIEEGRKYYFRNISWLGNTKYSTETLNRVLKINKGDVYDASYLQERLFMDPSGGDVSSLYLDNGYLFFDLNPVEVMVENDSIDIEMRIREGRQATVRNVTVVGNDRTNDKVIMRELRTKPGELFRRSDIQRSMRELQQLGFFEPTELNVNPKPDAETGTVDIEYSVVERSTSQLQLEGGWGGNTIVGTLGLSFNNFSARNFFNKEAWQPLPSGDGQTINLRATTNGTYYQSYSASFTEPWLGGKKPTSLTVSVYHNVQSNGQIKTSDAYGDLKVTGIGAGLGNRLKWPDDYFTLYYGADFQRYNLNNYGQQLLGLSFGDGILHNVNARITLGRNSTDYPIYPRRGSLFNITGEFTPPYSLWNDKNYADISDQAKYEWLEYYKIKVNSSWFTEIFNKAVIKMAGEFGYLGAYNDEVGLPPFERFYVGGDGLQNFTLDGREIVGLRGYPNQSINPSDVSPSEAGSVYNKFTLELRYLITENPNAQIFTLAFLEGGNNYARFQNYEPFNLKRSAGFGLRIFMPMFGLLGVDFGYGFDPFPSSGLEPSGWRTHFIIGQQF